MSLARNFDAAEEGIARLGHHAEKHDLRSYKACCLGFEGLLANSRGDIKAAERLLRSSLGELQRTQYEVLYTPILSGLAETLAAAGSVDDGLAVADEALQRTERNSALWWMPEALRIKGEILLLSDSADPSLAEDYFNQSIGLARRQGALSWELRAAMCLRRLWHAKGRADDASDLLNCVYARFTEGFETADLRSARRLIGEWAAAAE